MSVLIGPVGGFRHPFRVKAEVPVERQIGDHLVYAFDTKWLYSKLRLEPAEPIDLALLWDPGWMRNGWYDKETAPHNLRPKDEIEAVRQIVGGGAAVLALASDWFAAWGVGHGMHGTLGMLQATDGILIDPMGAATLRNAVRSLTMFGPDDYRYRTLVEMPPYLSYGALPNVGREDWDGEILSREKRSVDVSMVSNLYPNLVVARSYFAEKAQEICDRRGWSFQMGNKITAERMEELYLDSKVVLNVSLGSQANFRVYEALACGAALVTDGWNIGLDGAPCQTFTDAEGLEAALEEALMRPAAHARLTQEDGVIWARQRSPEKQWARIIDAALEAIKPSEKARAARRAREEEIEELAKTAPLTKDGRPVILV